MMMMVRMKMTGWFSAVGQWGFVRPSSLRSYLEDEKVSSFNHLKSNHINTLSCRYTSGVAMETRNDDVLGGTFVNCRWVHISPVLPSSQLAGLGGILSTLHSPLSSSSLPVSLPSLPCISSVSSPSCLCLSVSPSLTSVSPHLTEFHVKSVTWC